MVIANHSNDKRTKEPRNGNTKRRKRNRPPLPGGFSTKNSHTSPKRIALRRRQSEALRFREEGYNYEQIAKRMKTNPSTVYRWVMAAMDRITAEPAKRVLELELRRLDQLQTAIYADALEGDLSSQQMYLRIADQRARLLGLYPKEPQVHFNIGDGKPEAEPVMRIEFVLPDKPPPEPVDATPVPYANQPADLSRPAIEAPTARNVDPGYGMGPWRVDRDPKTGWMK
jgi:transposase-like protein